MATDLKALLEQRQALERQIQELQSSQRSEAIAQIRSLMTEYGLSVNDLSSKTTAKAPSASTGTKVAAKYRDPESGSTWSGRGLQPKWLKSAIEGGKKAEDFLIAPAQ